MSVSGDRAPVPPQVDVKACLKNFQLVNHELMRRALSGLSSDQNAVVNLLPLLFHYNSPELPGYVSPDTPFGIRYFLPEKTHQDAANLVLNGYRVQRRALLHYPIDAMFMMGSSSSIAFSRSSDFDVWLCPADGLSPDQLGLLEKKGRAISQWAETFRLEVHFFLVSADQFKEGRLDELSQESSGSAQRFMLLEEFYRSSIHMAGLRPLWWAVPTEQERNYHEYVQLLVKFGRIDLSEFIDLGPLPEIPTDEFYGAGLWQTFKGINSPYKSILKILLMESYAEDYPNVDLLSQRYKALIHGGVSSLDRLDPYILMFQKIEEYLLASEQTERLEVARACFYLKVNPQLSVRLTSDRAVERQSLLSEMVANWAWDNDQIVDLDQHTSWRIDQAVVEQRRLVKELMNSFKRLSAFSREHADSTAISAEDMNVLARRLYAAFERKPGKVALTNRTVGRQMLEPFCLLEQRPGRDGESFWSIYRITSQSQADSERTKLYQSSGVLEVLTWGHMNGVLSSKSHFSVRTSSSNLDVNEAKAILLVLESQFSRAAAINADVDAFNHNARTIASQVFINIGLDPFKRYTDQGVQLASNRSDPLCYGSAGINLIQRIDHVYINSWGEVYCVAFEGTDAVAKFMQHYFSQAIVAKQSVIPSPFHCFSSARNRNISQRLSQLVINVLRLYLPKGANRSARFVFALGRAYGLTQLKGRELAVRVAPDRDRLFSELSQPSERFRKTLFDSAQGLDSPLQAIFEHNQPGIIQFFFTDENVGVGVYCVDENGSAYFVSSQADRIDALQRQYYVFCMNIQRRMNMHCEETEQVNTNRLEFYRVLKKRGGGYLCRPHHTDVYDYQKSYFEISVHGEYTLSDLSSLTFYCDDEEFASATYGDDVLGAVAQYVFNKRRNGETYPVYITDLDTPEQFAQTGRTQDVQTIHYLKLKQAIEKQINASIGLLA